MPEPDSHEEYWVRTRTRRLDEDDLEDEDGLAEGVPEKDEEEEGASEEENDDDEPPPITGNK